MSVDEVEVKARETGDVYVLHPFLNDRPTVPFRQNVGTRLLKQLDATYHFPEPAVREFLRTQTDCRAVREWCNAAWRGAPPPRKTDTWERVFAVLRDRGWYGATGEEVQRVTGLGHGAVSHVLCVWDECGVAHRLAAPPPLPQGL